MRIINSHQRQRKHHENPAYRPCGGVRGGGCPRRGPSLLRIGRRPATIPIQFVSDYFWGEASGQTSGTVACPSGTKVVSSGASLTDNYGGAANLSSIAPNRSFTAATAQGRIEYGGHMQVTVGCAPAAQMTEVTTREINLGGAAGFRRGVVYCPAGMQAFGGGGLLVRQQFGVPSYASYGMTSNAVSADGTGWTFAATSHAPTDRLIIRTQCAPLRGSYPSHNHVQLTGFQANNVYAPCAAGYTALSGGVYLSKPDGNEVRNGQVRYSIPASGNRWYVNGVSFENYNSADKLVALAQCIR